MKTAFKGWHLETQPEEPLRAALAQRACALYPSFSPQLPAPQKALLSPPQLFEKRLIPLEAAQG